MGHFGYMHKFEGRVGKSENSLAKVVPVCSFYGTNLPFLWNQFQFPWYQLAVSKAGTNAINKARYYYDLKLCELNIDYNKLTIITT